MIGNNIGGGLYVGGAYRYLYLIGNWDFEMDISLGSLETAKGTRGPVGRIRSGKQPAVKDPDRKIDGVIKGKDAETSPDIST